MNFAEDLTRYREVERLTLQRGLLEGRLRCEAKRDMRRTILGRNGARTCIALRHLAFN
jgi:hypothetical protein